MNSIQVLLREREWERERERGLFLSLQSHDVSKITCCNNKTTRLQQFSGRNGRRFDQQPLSQWLPFCRHFQMHFLQWNNWGNDLTCHLCGTCFYNIFLLAYCGLVTPYCDIDWGQHKCPKCPVRHPISWPCALPTNDISIKFDLNLQCSGLKCTQPITRKFCTRHDNLTVVTCAKFRCDWWSVF